MIGLGSPVLGLKPVSYVCHQEAAVIRHVIRGWVKKKRSSRELAFASERIVEEEGGEKRLFRSMNISLFELREILVRRSTVFFREKEFEQNFRFRRETTLYMTVLSEY